MSSNTTTNSTDTTSTAASTEPVEDLGPQAEVITWVLVSLTFVFLALRLWCKWKKARGFWWDDYLLTLCFVFLIICGVILHYSVALGFGHHVYYLAVVSPQNLSPIAFLNYLSGTFSILAAVWSKTAFAFTLLRIAEARWFKITIWFIVVTINIAMILNAIFAFVQCNPVEKVWNVDLPGTCWTEIYSVYGVVSGVYSGVADIALALLPWQIIWGLQMKKAEKVGVAVAMSMGLFAGATAFVKSSMIPALANGDFPYDGYGLVVWGSCEVAMTIIGACIPVLRVLIRDVQTATRRRVYGTANSGGGTHSKSRTGGGTVNDTTQSRAGHHNTTVVGASGKNTSNRHGSASFSRPFGRDGLKPGQGGNGGGGTGAKEVHGDDWSERSIFHDDGMGGKIHTTHEVKVEYHARTGSSSSGGTPERNRSPRRENEYEMGRVV